MRWCWTMPPCTAAKSSGRPSTPFKALGIELWCLPPYAPELNAIERVFGVVKHQAMSRRTYTTVPQLTYAFHTAFRHIRDRLVSEN